MSDENAVLALQNACRGVQSGSDEIGKMAASLAEVPQGTPVEGLDLETYRRVTMSHATAAMALQGLVEELQRKREAGKQA